MFKKNILNKKKFYILGTIFLFGAVFAITLFPVILKMVYKPLSNDSYRMVEAVLLAISLFSYIVSCKYYKYQILAVFYAVLFYFVFVQVYSIFI